MGWLELSARHFTGGDPCSVAESQIPSIVGNTLSARPSRLEVGTYQATAASASSKLNFPSERLIICGRIQGEEEPPVPN